ncbi:NADH-quinone oxidoreductase subunit C [Marinoscillum sp. MHG1-6]|uniref:NADH-quinone oxidoreductase subunit C n=1 Tax=Marinoscillum sp. MHG1-6 TaxID=2959627 RepID=UPI0021587FC4|nr:NADH-quinone oxidoreductase subunit C [Marinoscillum sp. MHG1-6]
MTFEEIKSLVEKEFPGAVTGEDLNATPNALLVDAGKVREVCELLHADESTYFDSLSCLTGIDNGPEAGTMEVAYNLYSIPFDGHLSIRCVLDRTNPEIASVCDIWRTANWHEREAYDLVGIIFVGHPDLRRILLPKDWEGHPLQKDYSEQEKYHGITVVYDREDNNKQSF